MEYLKALEIAQSLIVRFEPYCERVQIAGSVRCENFNVGSIVICAIPKIGYESGLFEVNATPYSLLDDTLNGLGQHLKSGDRYKQISLESGINLDLYLCLPPAQWGVLYLVRTGPVDFSNWVVAPRRLSGALSSDCKVRDDGIYRGGKLIEMPEEIDFLNFLGIGWIPPNQRMAQWRR